jgi:hypothetical protein
MFTYFAINLSSKKFQVGSTSDFPRRFKEHLCSDMNPEFNRSLRKNPENFFWLVSEDDGLDDRSEEQFYLDFYYGTEWCYNANPNALEPPSQVGTKWWTDGVTNTISMDCPGDGWRPGRVVTRDHARKMSESGSGSVWWNNGVEETRAKECPGEGWVSGRVYSAEGKVAWTDGVNNTYNIEPPGPEWYRGITLSEEQRRRRGDANRGKKYGKRDPSIGRKISESKRGRKFSESHKNALSEARSDIPTLTCEICGKVIRGGKGNLRQHLHKHQREG